jgi:hypothetical protein
MFELQQLHYPFQTFPSSGRKTIYRLVATREKKTKKKMKNAAAGMVGLMGLNRDFHLFPRFSKMAFGRVRSCVSCLRLSRLPCQIYFSISNFCFVLFFLLGRSRAVATGKNRFVLRGIVVIKHNNGHQREVEQPARAQRRRNDVVSRKSDDFYLYLTFS